ncbi:MAG: hypothetical protein RML36_00960 [Anaerolineae bacterium]|nr:hypothetical protein [Anaerolineae bacterium]MDW8098037.1 hypothetical protein [Anaerolineae bacterium]
MESLTTLYRPAQAATLAGITLAHLREYTLTYAPFFSEHATPPPGEPRLFTPEDVRLLAFIAENTRRGADHEEVIQRLASGALEDFDWWLPEQERNGSPMITALVSVSQLQGIAEAFFQQAEETRAREEELRARLTIAEYRISQLESELATLRQQVEARNACVWRRWLGR